MYKFYTKKRGIPKGYVHKILLIMRLTTVLLFITMMQVSAASYGQHITLNAKHTALLELFKEIRLQSGYDFIFDGQLINKAVPVSIKVNNASLEEVLERCFKSQSFTYTIIDKTIIIKAKPIGVLDNLVRYFAAITVTGILQDENNRPLAGASVKIKGTDISAITNREGVFTLTNVDENAIILISFIGYDTKEIKAKSNLGTIVLAMTNSKLDDVQIIGYGTTTKRLNTGSISSMNIQDIEKQPVPNVLSALSGRMAGVFVQTTNGLPGGNINVSIRGKGSILAGTDPLYIVDGVPFSSSIIAGNAPINQSMSGPVSPLNSINPADILSLTVLKDADATSIYGSRGTNGVVLITTKHGTAGKTKVDFSINEGINKMANFPDILSLSDYLQLRREAYINDGEEPSADPTSSDYAPDLMVWDQHTSTDWAKYMFGGTGHISNANLSVSGGSEGTTFILSGNYRTESTILPGDNRYQRGGINFSMQHHSADHKFQTTFTTSYTADQNKSVNPSTSITTYILLPPNYPLFDAQGKYNWYESENPLAQTLARSKSNTGNILINTTMSYALAKGLELKASAGFNKLSIDNLQTYPSASLYPGTANYTNFGTNAVQSFIIEPQLNYSRNLGDLKLTALLGATYQTTLTTGQFISGSNFSSESLMENLASAGTIASKSNTYTDYRYASLFGRITLNWKDKYILNGTLRRDGSSRFGPGNQYGNFGSVGGAWLFSNEEAVKNSFSFLSYGKLRMSYGLTGNDQIQDYQYLSTYSNSPYVYQNVATLKPSRIYNDQFHWETTRKFEMALELGFFKDRILFNVNKYQNRSKDQLIQYTLPNVTGFSSYQANLPAVVQNSGWEFELNTKNIQKRDFNWTTTFNITLPKNILKSFENFESSSYSQTLQLGYDITRISGYTFINVDPETGVALYQPQAGSTSSSPYYYNTVGKKTPDFFGGIGNTFTFKQFELDIFGQFAKQKAVGGIAVTPGFDINNYSPALARWTKPGDQATMPKSSIYFSDYYWSLSSANFFDASYFRLKNASLSYSFKGTWLTRNHIDKLKIYVQGENMLTFWNKNSALLDPESGALSYSAPNIPPMKTYSFGLQLIF